MNTDRDIVEMGGCVNTGRDNVEMVPKRVCPLARACGQGPHGGGSLLGRETSILFLSDET